MTTLMHIIAGCVCLVIGLVLWPLPIPLGIPLIVLGLALLAPHTPFIQRIVRALRRKYKKLDDQFIKWRDKCPPIIQRTIDLTKP